MIETHFKYIMYKDKITTHHYIDKCMHPSEILCNPAESPPPSNTTATTPDHNCTVITLQWDIPDTPSDITSAVSCTSSSTACGACTSSPCNITDLTLNTDFNFTVTLNSGMCGTSVTTTTARTMGETP